MTGLGAVLPSAARANSRCRSRCAGRLVGARNWLAGEALSYADLAAGHLSCVAYFGDASWGESETAKA
jgi:glutathione S-transferase